MPTNKRVFTMRLSDEVFDKIGALAAREHRSMTNYIEYVLLKHVETLNFLTRMSARYARLLAEPVAKLAGEVVDHCEKANSIFPSDEQRINLRKAHLLEARASLKALDVILTRCYTVMMQNPEGCFTTSSGRQVGSKEAIEKLDRMAANLGEMIDHEDELIKGNIKSVGQSKAKQ